MATAKLLFLGALLMGTTVLDKKLDAYYGINTPDLVHVLLYLCAYLILLSLEIRSRLLKSASQRRLRWMGFIFTFWAVTFFFVIPVLISRNFTSGDLFSDSRYNIYSLFVFSMGWGLLAGVVGMFITQLMVLFLFKQPEEL